MAQVDLLVQLPSRRPSQRRLRVASTSTLPGASTHGPSLLSETLSDGSSNRDSISVAEDHLEDLLSMPLAPELKSRRSQHKLRSDTPSSSSLYSTYTDSPTVAARAPLDTFAASPSRSPQSNTKPRGGSSGIPAGAVPASTSSRIPFGRSRSQSGPARKPSSPRREGGTDEWETLQVAALPQSSTSTLNRESRAASSGMARSSTAGSLPSSSSSAARVPLNFPLPSPVPQPPAPVTTTTTPRKRAQTSHLGARSSPSSRATSPTPFPSQPPQHTALSTSGSPRDHYKPPPTSHPAASSSPPPAAKKARRKSFSAATSFKTEESDPQVRAPWLEDGPRVFRAKAGDLKAEGSIEDMVLPAVARRLEMERLARLGVDSVDGLITTWDRDGQPQTVLALEMAQRPRVGEKKPLDRSAPTRPSFDLLELPPRPQGNDAHSSFSPNATAHGQLTHDAPSGQPPPRPTLESSPEKEHKKAEEEPPAQGCCGGCAVM